MNSTRFAVAGFKHFHILEFVRGMREVPGAQLVGVYDADPALRDRHAAELEVPGFDSLDALVERSEPDVVGVAVENGEKANTIERLTELGCHVLADKPLTTSLPDLDRIENAAARTGKHIGLMLLLRYHGPLRAVRNQLRAGALGRLASFVSLAPHKLNPEGRPEWMFDPQLYGGVLNDLEIHDVDIMRWLMNEEPVSVAASEGCLRFTQYPGFTDHASVLLEFADSATALLRADWLTPEAFPAHGDGRQFFECTGGTVEVRAAPDIHMIGEGTVVVDWWDRPREELAPAPPEKSLYAEFVDLCQGDGTAELLPADGFRSTRVTLYAAEAARTHQRIDLRGML